MKNVVGVMLTQLVSLAVRNELSSYSLLGFRPNIPTFKTRISNTACMYSDLRFIRAVS